MKKGKRKKILVRTISGMIIAMMVTLNASTMVSFAEEDVKELSLEDASNEQNEYETDEPESVADENSDVGTQKNVDIAEENEYEDTQNACFENSWRYKGGELLPSEELGDFVANNGRARSVTPWTNINGLFYNSFGEIIPGVIAKGIDVSEHNGVINWELVKNTDVNYAIIRCGYGDNYTYQDDKQWINNVSACERLGIPYGVYIYSYASSVDQARSEAEHVLRLVAGHNINYPIYFDLEEESIRSKVSADGIAQIAKTFCDIVQSAGYSVGIYANYNWFTNYLINPQFNNYPKWVAQYNYQCDYQGTYTMWQCTSSGSINGIAGRVDINMDFGSAGAPQNRLVKEDGITYCYKGSQQLFGEQKVAGKWYYFDNEIGAMQTGFVDLANKTVYYGNDGAMLYGEQRIDNKWYYFDKVSGAMQTSFVNLGHKIVCYGNDGAMLYGEQRINNKWYYFDKVTGAMQTSFVNLGHKIVCYGNDGAMLYGEQRIDGKWYYFDKVSGAMQIGFVNLGHKTVYYGNDGAMLYGTQNIDDRQYYFDKVSGAMQIGFHHLENKTMYYGNDGAMRYEEQRIDGKWYYFDKTTGVMQTDFVDLGNKTVYYGNDGAMKYGEQRIDGKWYYFDKITGAMQTGFVNLGNKTVYYDANGVMQYGKQVIDGKNYYFDKITGAMEK